MREDGPILPPPLGEGGPPSFENCFSLFFFKQLTSNGASSFLSSQASPLYLPITNFPHGRLRKSSTAVQATGCLVSKSSHFSGSISSVWD